MKLIALLNDKEIPIEITKIDGQYRLTFEDKSFTVDAIWPNKQTLSMLIDGKSYEVALEKKRSRVSVYFYNDTIELELFDARKFRVTELAKKTTDNGPVEVLAPMPGKIIKVTVAENSQVNEGDSLLIMEAMKMQNELKAPKSGTVKHLHVKEGEPVSSSQILLILE